MATYFYVKFIGDVMNTQTNRIEELMQIALIPQIKELIMSVNSSDKRDSGWVTIDKLIEVKGGSKDSWTKARQVGKLIEGTHWKKWYGKVMFHVENIDLCIQDFEFYKISKYNPQIK